jgi:uncharacterized protein (DUF983 family)
VAYQPTPSLQAYWDRFPLIIHLSKVRCPMHRQQWLFMDEITETAYCFTCDRDWTTVEVVAWAAARGATTTDRPRLPEALRQYYPRGVTCPTCGRRLQLRLRTQEGFCPTCEADYTFDALMDAAANVCMQEPPLGAVPYHKPRHGR